MIRFANGSTWRLVGDGADRFVGAQTEFFNAPTEPCIDEPGPRTMPFPLRLLRLGFRDRIAPGLVARRSSTGAGTRGCPQRRRPSFCCQSCGAAIGYLGRAIDCLTRPFGFVLHRCAP